MQSIKWVFIRQFFLFDSPFLLSLAVINDTIPMYAKKNNTEETMERKAIRISLDKNPNITIDAIPGHFTTSNTHFNYYLDVNTLKTNALVARDVADELAIPYETSINVDTIVCMDNTEVIGAYLAGEMINEGSSMINAGNDIRILTPVYNTHDKLIFKDNVIDYVTGCNIVLLVASISSGSTVKEAMECLSYYGGNVVGISSLFMTVGADIEPAPHTLFTSDDIPDYKMYRINQCELCKAGRKLDAVVSSNGYTRL